jgi:putative membrane protein
MSVIANIFVALVALEHFYILVLQMFMWTSPRGRKAFRMSPQKAEATQVMAANQGLYNGILVAGLVWSLVQRDPMFAFQLKLFFVGAVITAGLYGGLTVSRRIALVQGVPAIIAFVLVLLAGL